MNFTYTKEVGEGEEKRLITLGLSLDYVVNWIYDGEVLYLFLNEQIEAIKILPVPVKSKPTKDNPSGWHQEQQARTVKESYTLEVTDKEAIERFLAYQKSTSI